MSYPGACEKCGGDTGQDRIDVLVRELADANSWASKLVEEVNSLKEQRRLLGEELDILKKEMEFLRKAPTWMCNECAGQWVVSGREEGAK